MAKKQKSQKRRLEKKILDAFHLAERQESGYASHSDDSDEYSVRDGIMDARHLLKEARGGKNDPLTDEELDSDEAFGSDDEFDVLESKFLNTLREKEKKGTPEDESGYDSIDESQLVTLSEAWDLDDRDLAKGKSGDTALVLDDEWQSEESASESESGSESESEDSTDEEALLRGSDDDEVDLTATKKKLSRFSEQSELVNDKRDENEFDLPAGGKKLSMAEMLGTAASAAPLVSTEKSATVAVPLPKRVQDRNDRKAAYEMTKEELNKWKDSVRQIRDAAHVEFPLMRAEESEEEEDFQFVKDAQQKNDLESKVDELLRKSALLDESAEQRFEDIQAAKLSKEDMVQRTQELRRMRELMFRDEQRAKRIKKIKSKQYHKIKKRERLRDASLVLEESEDEDHDMKRAEERMSLRHKTQSKWARDMIKSGITKDASTRAELEEMLRSGERLRARKMGYVDGEQSDDEISDIEREYANDDQKKEEEERGLLGKGVLAMDFMKNADERRKKENQRQLAFLREVREGTGIEAFENESTSINNQENQGRRTYSQKVNAAKAEMEQMDEEVLHDYRDDEALNLVLRMTKKESTREKEVTKEAEDKEEDEDKEDKEEEEFQGFDENPWLLETSTKQKRSHVVDQSSSKLSKSANKISKHLQKSQKTQKNPETLVDLDQVMHMGGDINASDSEGETFRQTDLIQEAFAGDDVVSEFRAEKRKHIEEDDDKEEDATLPGWGGWGGAGITKKPKKKFVRKIDGVVAADKRKDKNLDSVIINENVSKLSLRYQSAVVPFPFESREQYERSLRMPIGEEWASKETFQKSILPRVSIRQGEVIDPMQAPFK